MLAREFILKMQFYFVEVFLSLPEQSILKVECNCLPGIEFYVLLDLFWTWPRHRPTPQSGWDVELIIGVTSQDCNAQPIFRTLVLSRFIAVLDITHALEGTVLR